MRVFEMLYSKQDFNVLADAADDRERWLEVRKTILTSSDVFTFRGVGVPDWWGSTRNDILGEKVDGVQKQFAPEESVSIAHGAYDEMNIARKFGEGIGAEVQCVNWLVVSERWGNLGASIDGFCQPVQSAKPDYRFFQDRASTELVREDLLAQDKPVILELKKSTSRAWQKYCPDYYLSQLQTQMHILDIPAAVIVSDTLKDVRHYDNSRRKPYFRRYWDMKAYVVYRDPAWADILDGLNEEFEREWDSYVVSGEGPARGE